MVKYGLSPGTLKGVLFIILSEQGNNGMKVYDLVKSLRVSYCPVEFVSCKERVYISLLPSPFS